ncbi:hypothetical protein PsorP6_007896 [Peronosclerospora sorghi]|uniref:Uncharacterized protein n=1 Tax=Peronosclerospora sorghi TaxID=230839 RepID=A0ACC0WA78_9STRA|nr:hypothetical protein PsorP6_007896 [Peronosclerospora sorghi]
MRDGTTKALEEASAYAASQPYAMPREMQITHLVDSLKHSASTAQQPLLDRLSQRTTLAGTFASSTSWWISNQLYITNASIELVHELEAESAIEEIRVELILTMEDDFKVDPMDRSAVGTTTEKWSLAKIGAEAVWAQGILGENITIATIDTGARATHEALRATFRGDYGWFDPETKTRAPFDSSGHGTHVLGSIVGQHGIGVAPKASWMACRGCHSSSSCLESSLLACAQFMLCPTDPSGTNANCSKAPRIVNNSWGVKRGTPSFFRAVLAAWEAAGIIPIFAIGNSGSVNTCGTLSTPGDAPNVIGVGAMNADDLLFPQSATGPSREGRVKPDLVAPGVRIYSAWGTTDNAYAITSGTSMASPHVAGAVALLLSAKPELTFSQVWTAVTHSTVRDERIEKSAASHTPCGNTSARTFPNNIVGYGRLDAQRAVATVLQSTR